MPAHAGDATVSVRSVTGMSVGDTVHVGEGSEAESRKIAALGTAASDHTTLWQPLPEGPVITLPPESSNVPVQSVSGFKVGEKIALGYGAGYPSVGRGTEQYETATVTAVGKPGMQAYLAADVPAGATNLKVTDLSDITAGDKIRLDIDSVGHGIETVTVTRVGTKAEQTNLTADVNAGANRITVRRAEGMAAGDKITVGTPATMETVTVASVQSEGEGREAAITFTPGLASKHGRDEWVVAAGTGIGVAAPLRFAHAANLPFGDRGTGISFKPATRYAHASNEPIQALGSGVTLDRPLAKSHPVNAVVEDDKVRTAGYQGTPKPNQWFGGPELSTRFLQFGRVIPVEEGSMVLRDAAGVVVDSLNYGGLVDPWAAEGYQAASGVDRRGCFVPTPDTGRGFGMGAAVPGVNRSASRFPDGADTGSNCQDFHVQPATVIPNGAAAGSTTIKVASVFGFHPGEKVMVGTGGDLETVEIAKVGTAGAVLTGKDVAAGATVIPVASFAAFRPGQSVTIGSGAESETVEVASLRRLGGWAITVAAPLQRAHAAGVEVAGTGLTLAAGLTRAHAAGAQVAVSLPTPGAPNQSGPEEDERAAQ